jgi:hypothetical protein
LLLPCVHAQAILRRLNGGMDQLVKMMGQHAPPPAGASTGAPTANGGGGAGPPAAADVAGDGSQPAAEAGAAAAGAAGAAGDSARAAGQAALREAAAGLQHAVRVVVPRPGQPDFVQVVHSFRWGVRRFSLQDDILVKRGRIVRLRRSRG